MTKLAERYLPEGTSKWRLMCPRECFKTSGFFSHERLMGAVFREQIMLDVHDTLARAFLSK